MVHEALSLPAKGNPRLTQDTAQQLPASRLLPPAPCPPAPCCHCQTELILSFSGSLWASINSEFLVWHLGPTQLGIAYRFVFLSVSLSRVLLFATPWTGTLQAPLSMEIFQARILEWVAMPSSRGSSQPRDRTRISRIAGGFFIVSATRETQYMQHLLSFSHYFKVL